MAFYDFHVRLTHSTIAASIGRMCTIARELGYSGLAVETPTRLPEDLCESLRLYRRLTLSLPNASRLKLHAKKNRNRTDLLVIQGHTKPICLAAAAASAVDMIMLHHIEDFETVDSLVARTISANKKHVEVCLGGLLQSSGPSRSRLMRSMATAVDKLVRAKCAIIVTSGATAPLELRAPRDLMALTFLANIPEEVAKQSMYNNAAVLAEVIQRRVKERQVKSKQRSKQD